MSVENLLSRLDKVKKTGQGEYLACCPAHNDKTPSLSIGVEDDGLLLIHCFAGCSVCEVIGAVGLEMSDLYPKKRNHAGKPKRRPFPATDALRAISFEVMIVLISAGDILAGKFLESDRERLAVAVERIQSALTACGTRHGT